MSEKVELKCMECGHTWAPDPEERKQKCPKCGSKKWVVSKHEGTGVVWFWR